METCIWSYFKFGYYFQLNYNFVFQIIGKREGQWVVKFIKQLHPKWIIIDNSILSTKKKYYFKTEDNHIVFDVCPTGINNQKQTDFSKLEYERFGVGYKNNKNGRSCSKVTHYASSFFFNWL